MAVVRLILRLSSSRPRPLAAVPALLRLVVVRSSPSAQVPRKPPWPNIKVATLSERAQARGTHAGRRGSRDPLYSFNSLHSFNSPY